MVREVARLSKSSALNITALEVFYQLPALFNKIKKYDEAIESAKYAIKREAEYLGRNSSIRFGSMAELAKALCWSGKQKQSQNIIQYIFREAMKG